ncbi:MAG: hypothetical protein Q4A59_04390 [Erysipelotrichaceae bacterium]|nr:hypothetical protein [Erysipelotrichaceae bacterium]
MQIEKLRHLRRNFSIETSITQDNLKKGLPPDLLDSIKTMNASWAIEESGQTDDHWDIAWCDLYSAINSVSPYLFTNSLLMA